MDLLILKDIYIYIYIYKWKKYYDRASHDIKWGNKGIHITLWLKFWTVASKQASSLSDSTLRKDMKPLIPPAMG